MGAPREDFEFLWQHEHGSKWISYGPKQLAAINKAYQKGQKTVTLPGKDEKTELVLNLYQMYQKNKVSGWEQRIRCCVYDRNCFHVWQWKDEDNWNCYMPQIAVDLESAFRRDKEVKFYYNDDYVCCPKTMKQKNENTGTVRDMMRQKIRVDVKGKHLNGIAEVFSATMICKVEADVFNSTDESSPKRAKLDDGKEESTSLKHSVPVDPACTQIANLVHVYSDETGVYDAMLSQTNLLHNNNKFYRLQLLKYDSEERYFVWFHWGRVGKNGQNNLIPFRGALKSAITEFCTKFYDKTKNQWTERDKFKTHPGKYELLKMDYDTEKAAKRKVSTPELKSQLHPKIEGLLRLISNVDEMKNKIVEMKFDLNKIPLGKLNEEQIKAGYRALRKIELILQKKDLGSKLLEACNAFYTKIPHDFGMKTPPIISTFDDLKEKLELLEALSDIELNVQLQKDGTHEDNPLVYLYGKLNCELKVLDKETDMYNLAVHYLQNTRGPTHNAYDLEVVDIFECNKSNEKDRFKDYGNKCLLWHGSRLSNFVGILKNGLKIAPPEAPSTGYMFGKGVYFADICTKSANYCFPTKLKNEGLLVLCEVSLGEQNVLHSAYYRADEEAKRLGKHSTMGEGKYIPDPEVVAKIDGVKIPYGTPVENGNDPGRFDLNYNEFIVYDECQVKIRYIIHVKFLFK